MPLWIVMVIIGTIGLIGLAMLANRVQRQGSNAQPGTAGSSTGDGGFVPFIDGGGGSDHTSDGSTDSGCGDAG